MRKARKRPAATIPPDNTGLSPSTPLSSPPITNPNMPAHITAPSTSNGSGRVFGSGNQRPNRRESNANGTALAKTHGQGAIPRTSPPSDGAIAAPLDTTSELSASPRPNWFEG